jgi:hypothetical protein
MPMSSAFEPVSCSRRRKDSGLHHIDYIVIDVWAAGGGERTVGSTEPIGSVFLRHAAGGGQRTVGSTLSAS